MRPWVTDPTARNMPPAKVHRFPASHCPWMFCALSESVSKSPCTFPIISNAGFVLASSLKADVAFRQFGGLGLGGLGGPGAVQRGERTSVAGLPPLRDVREVDRLASQNQALGPLVGPSDSSRIASLLSALKYRRLAGAAGSVTSVTSPNSVTKSWSKSFW